MNIRPLSKPLQEKAEKELNEIPSKNQECLEILKNWLAKQQHLKYKNDDQLMMNFLRCCKFNIEKTKEKLDGYYTFRTIAPEISKSMDPLLPSFQVLFNNGFVNVLPLEQGDPASVQAILVKLGKYDPDELTTLLLAKFIIASADILFYDFDNFIVSGIKVIWDMKNLQYKNVLQTTPTLLKKFVYSVQHAYPIRIKGYYFINVPNYCDPLFSLLKHFCSKKLAEKLHFYTESNSHAIYEHFPKSVLPTEYGGEAGPIDNLSAEWKKHLENNREKLLQEDNYYSDESKRIGSSTNANQFFGAEGTFRKLVID